MALPEFSLVDLYAAIDAQRHARGLTWSAAMSEISGPFVSGRSRPLALSTVKGLRTKPVAEGDGVLQLLRWLGRTPESFVAGIEFDARAALPVVGPGDVLRFDTRRLHAALNTTRAARGLTWQQIASDVDMSAASLTHLSKGGRTGFPHVVRLARWLGAPTSHFIRITSR